MPECGWSPKPENGVPRLSMRSRNTKGFRSRPKSDGDMRRVIGPCFFPRVRSAMRGIEPGSRRVVLDISLPLRPAGKTPDRNKKGEQEQHSWRGWRLVAADMVENCE